MINSISIAISGLLASAKSAEVGASNIANAHSLVPVTSLVGQKSGYTPQSALALSSSGGSDEPVTLKRSPAFSLNYEPNSPLANSDGLVSALNINNDEELINLRVAENAYKANTISLKTGLEMQDVLTKTLDHKA